MSVLIWLPIHSDTPADGYQQGEEQYMVKWKPIIASNAFSWHYLDELSNCLELLQDYLEARRRSVRPVRA